MKQSRKRRPVRLLSTRFLWPVERYLGVETTGGLVLLIATLLALLWANSPLASLYETFWSMPLGGPFPGEAAPTLHFWVNEGLMTVFFLVVGLEIRRELQEGALSDRSVAALPVIAALGGVAVPALLYLAIAGGSLPRGWAVPTATDIAFAVGALSLLGRGVPRSLRMLLLTLAIVDDIAAILVIAFVYTGGIGWRGMLLALLAVALILVLQRLRVRFAAAYALAGLLLWLGFLDAGVHPTLAGVLLGLLTPVRRPVHGLRVEDTLHPWVAYGVMPLFALANAGISLAGIALSGGAGLAALGIVAGLVLGKPVGILGASALAVRLRWCTLPQDVTARHMLLLGCLGGIGFTMSIFIAGLAFARPAQLAAAKLAVLCASLLAAMTGLAVGRLILRR